MTSNDPPTARIQRATLFITRKPSFLITPGRLKIILVLASPIIIQSGSQNLLTLADTAMVGTMGNPALAAIGLSNYSYYILTAFVSGLMMCCQTMTARYKGEGRTSDLAWPLNGTLFFGLIIAFCLTPILVQLVPKIFTLLTPNETIRNLGIPYLQARVISVIGISINSSYYGFLIGIGKTKLCLKVGLVMQMINLLANYSLIFGHFGLPELGVTGAGIGSTFSTYMGSIMYTILILKISSNAGFLKRLPERRTLLTILRLLSTSALHQVYFILGILMMMWIIARIGTRETAIANVLLNLYMLALVPCIALGLSAATLVGQALGRQDPDDAKRWGWDSAQAGMLIIGIISIPLILFPNAVLSLFLHDIITRQISCPLLQLTACMILVDSFGLVILHGLVGAGDIKRVVIVNIVLQTVIFLPLIYYLVTIRGFGIGSVWILLFGYRLINAVIMGMLWKKGKWHMIKL